MPNDVLETRSSLSESLDLPTEEEIHETFERLGLVGISPSGYSYIATNPVHPARVFDVVRTSNSDRLA